MPTMKPLSWVGHLGSVDGVFGGAAGFLACLLVAGCASPGPPRAPSLQLPAVVSDLQATRRGDDVELVFAPPTLTTDGLPYRGAGMRGTVCRAVDAGSCVPVAGLTGVALAAAQATGSSRQTTLRDALPGALTSGPARLLTYRVELSNNQGRTAGYGDAAYAAAGVAPARVEALTAAGSRQGVVVRWQAARGDVGAATADVVLRRELVGGTGAETGQAREGAKSAGPGTAPGTAQGGGQATGVSEKTGKRGAPGKRGVSSAQKMTGTGKEPGVVWLSTRAQADPLGSDAPEARPAVHARGEPDVHGVVDESAALDSTYRYAAERQQTAQLGGHTVVLHSVLSAPVEVTLRAVYPPPAPTDLVGTVFPLAPGDAGGANAASGGASSGLAVDLIWTPADDAKTVGYKVSRETVDASGAPGNAPVLLTAQPVPMSAFHEVLPAALVAGAQRFRYSVVAVDANGLESAAVTTVVEVRER